MLSHQIQIVCTIVAIVDLVRELCLLHSLLMMTWSSVWQILLDQGMLVNYTHHRYVYRHR